MFRLHTLRKHTVSIFLSLFLTGATLLWFLSILGLLNGNWAVTCQALFTILQVVFAVPQFSSGSPTEEKINGK